MIEREFPDPPIGPTALPDEPELAQLADLAVVLARRAGVLMLERRQRVLAVSSKSSSTDLVTDADQAVEEFLVAELARLRPADSILAEESSAAGGLAASEAATEVRWVIDPIDGTVNFLLGQPQFAVSIAVQVAGQSIAGVVFNPVSGDCFHAQLGHGSYLQDRTGNRVRLLGPRSIALQQAVVATGFSYDRSRRAHQGRVVAGLLPRVANLRRAGSAALDLCSLAAGWVDLYFEGPINEWDYAAGLLIGHEAGVVSSGLDGRAAGPAMVAAAHPDNAESFFALLADLRAAG